MGMKVKLKRELALGLSISFIWLLVSMVIIYYRLLPPPSPYNMLIYFPGLLLLFIGYFSIAIPFPNVIVPYANWLLSCLLTWLIIGLAIGYTKYCLGFRGRVFQFHIERIMAMNEERVLALSFFISFIWMLASWIIGAFHFMLGQGARTPWYFMVSIGLPWGLVGFLDKIFRYRATEFAILLGWLIIGLIITSVINGIIRIKR